MCGLDFPSPALCASSHAAGPDRVTTFGGSSRAVHYASANRDRAGPPPVSLWLRCLGPPPNMRAYADLSFCVKMGERSAHSDRRASRQSLGAAGCLPSRPFGASISPAPAPFQIVYRFYRRTSERAEVFFLSSARSPLHSIIQGSNDHQTIARYSSRYC